MVSNLKSAFDILNERGFIEQTTHEDEIKQALSKEKVKFYIGFDPTADSLTVGHFVTVMAMAHLQRAGHIPIVLVGGGTVLVGDPTGKTDMRKMLTKEQIQNNCHIFKEQLSKFIDFTDNKAYLVDNADWLLDLNYVKFIREIGVHFSVNRMLTAECYKSRLEKGLTFLEFNYMLMQSYDFLELNRRYDCTMQLGGNDQWSNILGGVELVRRVEKKQAFGMTFKLLTTSEGKKMGKTESGAVWLDPEKTTPYEFFQYWRNIEDESVSKCLALLTFLPMERVNELSELKDEKINTAKEVLAYELTKIIHGEEEASRALEATKALFSGGAMKGSIPTTEINKSEIVEGILIIDILIKCNLTTSKAEARRLISQGGVKINSEKIDDVQFKVSKFNISKESDIMIQKGKKVFHRIVVI